MSESRRSTGNGLHDAAGEAKPVMRRRQRRASEHLVTTNLNFYSDGVNSPDNRDQLGGVAPSVSDICVGDLVHGLRCGPHGRAIDLVVFFRISLGRTCGIWSAILTPRPCKRQYSLRAAWDKEGM